MRLESNLRAAQGDVRIRNQPPRLLRVASFGRRQTTVISRNVIDCSVRPMQSAY